MSAVLGEVLAFALGIALSPFPVVPAILLLLSPLAEKGAAAFLGGWVLGVGAVTAAATELAAVLAPADQPPTWAAWARLALGVALVGLGVRQWRGRGSGGEPPGWMSALDGYSAGRALRLGLLLSAANPKVVLLAVGAGMAIGTAELTTRELVVAVVTFTVVSSLSVATPLLAHLLLGDRVNRPLVVARGWLVRNNDAVVAVVVAVLGVMLVAKGVGGL